MKPEISCSLRVTAFALFRLKSRAVLIVEEQVSVFWEQNLLSRQTICLSSVCLACTFCWPSVANGFRTLFLYGLFLIPVTWFSSSFFIALNKAQFLKGTFRAFSSSPGFCPCHYRRKILLVINFLFLAALYYERHVVWVSLILLLKSHWMCNTYGGQLWVLWLKLPVRFYFPKCAAALN